MTVWRPAMESDWPAIEKLHAVIEDKVGKKMDLPWINDPSILLFWVAERDGEVVQFFYLEKQVECCFGGQDAEAMQALRAIAGEVLGMASAKGIRFVHTQIPVAYGDEIDKTLSKFRFDEVTDKYRRFVSDLR